ncbi:MAG: gamma-glutamyl-gamma-aminobutyrate hydrolase family protein [Phycisphaerae bacterium]
MILYVVTETAKRYRAGTGWFATKLLLEKLSGDSCLVIHYKQVSAKALADMRPWAICHSGSGTLYSKYDVLQWRPYRQAVLDCDVAQIGFCGGHQILAHFFGCTLGPIRRLRPGEHDPSPYSPGHFKEWGVYPVRIVRRDPIFAGLPKVIRVQEYHFWEVKKLSPELVLLASTDECRVQAYVHRDRPVYGTQFHPEASPKTYTDGLKLLRNFFRVARDYSRARAEA